MRFNLVVALVGIMALPAGTALAQSSRDACTLMPMSELQAVLGSAPTQVEEQGAGTGTSFCHWRGADGQGVQLHWITAASQGIVGGTPLEYFTQRATARKENLGAQNVQDIDGPWQAATLVDIKEDNPDQVRSVSLINKDDTVTVETYGLDVSVTRSLAEAVARAM